MKIKAKMKDGRVEVKLLAKHPMETGLRKNKDGEKIPAHYIEKLTGEIGGRTAIIAHLGPAVSKDPYLKFYAEGAAGELVRCVWSDNRGESTSAETKVK
jgi:sulfur-oxidizing protein SoxZ